MAWRAAPSPRPGSSGSGAVPELPEVETIRSGLARHVAGRRFASVEILHPRAARRHAAGADDLAAALRGRVAGPARRRGKYLWLPVDGDALLIHLGMSGQLLLGDPARPLSSHVRARFTFADGGPDLRFVDQRTFGHLALAPAAPALRRRSPTSPPTRWSPPSTTSGSPPGCVAGGRA